MTTKTQTRKPARMRGLVLAMALTATASGGLFTPNRADAYIASEITQILNNVSLMFSQFQHYYRYADDAAKWQQQMREMQRQISKVQNMAMSLGLKPGQQLTPVDEDFNVAERCGGFSLSSLTQVFNINKSGDIYAQQKQVCTNIQKMENMKFNETVEYLTVYKERAEREMAELNSLNRATEDQGDMLKRIQDSMARLNGNDSYTEHFQNQMEAYDGYIEIMRNNQRMLGQIALKGSKAGNVLGQLGKTAILEAALSD